MGGHHAPPGMVARYFKRRAAQNRAWRSRESSGPASECRRIDTQSGEVIGTYQPHAPATCRAARAEALALARADAALAATRPQACRAAGGGGPKNSNRQRVRARRRSNFNGRRLDEIFSSKACLLGSCELKDCCHH
jgi:hypothetical protein